MRRLIVVGTVLLFAGAPASSYADSVIGAGEIGSAGGQPNNVFLFRAVSNPAGAGGVALFGEPTSLQAFGGPVQCLRVDGNRASMVISLRVGINAPPRFVGGGAVIFVEDNGTASPSETPVDRQQNRRLTAAQLAAQLQAGCPAPIVPASRILSGDIAVTDT
jgi:hypothetical protein